MKLKLLFTLGISTLIFLSSCKRERYNSSYVLIQKIVPQSFSGVLNLKTKLICKKGSRNSNSYFEAMAFGKDSVNENLLISFDSYKKISSENIGERISYIQMSADDVKKMHLKLKNAIDEFKQMKVIRRNILISLNENTKISFLVENSGYTVSYTKVVFYCGDKVFRAPIGVYQKIVKFMLNENLYYAL